MPPAQLVNACLRRVPLRVGSVSSRLSLRLGRNVRPRSFAAVSPDAAGLAAGETAVLSDDFTSVLIVALSRRTFCHSGHILYFS